MVLQMVAFFLMVSVGLIITSMATNRNILYVTAYVITTLPALVLRFAPLLFNGVVHLLVHWIGSLPKLFLHDGRRAWLTPNELYTRVISASVVYIPDSVITTEHKRRNQKRQQQRQQKNNNLKQRTVAAIQQPSPQVLARKQAQQQVRVINKALQDYYASQQM